MNIHLTRLGFAAEGKGETRLRAVSAGKGKDGTALYDVTMSGGRFGPHHLRASGHARIIEHWKGYQEIGGS